MEYDTDFTKSFMSRTLELAQEYEGEYDATLLLNCLLGLLVVPKEKLFLKIPEDPLETLSKWGIEPTSIKNFGTCNYGHSHEPNLRQLVRRLRNAVAHFKINPIYQNGEVKGYRFRDSYGFRAELTLTELNHFVTELARYFEDLT